MTTIHETDLFDQKHTALAQPRIAFSWFEWLIVPGIIVLQLLILGDPIPFTHSFWLDEIHTQLLVEDTSLAHAATALAGGVDFNPPTYYLMAKLVASFGLSPEISQRAFSLVCVVICCVCVYRLVRDDCSRATAAVSVLLIWSNEVVQTQAFESRFYAPWLAATGLTALCLQRNSTSNRVGWRMGLVIGSTVMCTVHYFGVISLGLLAAAQILKNVVQRRGGAFFLVWLAPAMIALAICVATFYSGQRSALTIATWVPDPGWNSTLQFLRELIPIWSLGIGFLFWLASRHGAAKTEEPLSRPELADVARDNVTVNCTSSSVSGIPAAVGLVLMPCCLIVFSILLQPALVSRYASVGTVGFAVLVALMLRPAPKCVAIGFGICLFIAGLRTLGSQADRWHRTEERQAAMIARLRQVDRSVPLLFESRHAMYPITRYAPDLAPRVRFLSLSDHNLQEYVSATPFRIVERDVAERIEEFYPTYQTFSFDKLNELPQAIIVAFRQRKDFGRQLAGFSVAQLQPQIYEVRPLLQSGVLQSGVPDQIHKPVSGDSLVGNQ